MNTSKSEGTSWGKQFQLNLITSLIWFLFFKYRFPFTHMLPLFQGNFILGDATSSHFFQSNYFDKAVTFSGSHFFRTAAFFSFFRTVTFSQELFFQYSFFFGTKLLQSKHFLRIRSFLRQLFSGAAIFSGGTVKDKDI